jgi:uncharacterized protein YpbB
MILPQKAMVALANGLPQSMPALKLVKGMGKKKAGKFGKELLDIIISYCSGENIDPPAEVMSGEKIPKKKKEDTKKISFTLFKEGKSIPQISEERQLSFSTIEGHLAHYVGTGEIELNEVVAQERAKLIAACIEETGELRAGPVKEFLGDQVSWSEIRFVIKHLSLLRNIEASSL